MANKINFQVGFTVDKTGLNTLQSELQQISNSVKSMKPEALTPELKKAGQTASELDRILEKTFNSDLGTLNVTKFNQELAKSGMTLKSVQTDLSNYGNTGATAYNRMAQAILGTNVQLKESNKLLDSMATTMMNTIKWGITSSIFNTIANSINKAYGYVKDLDKSLNNIRIVTEKSADEMDIFAEKANNAAKALGASTLDYTNASLIYYQQGLSDEETAARAETTVKVANVTGQTGQAVSEQLTAVWNGYKVSAEETEVYVDKLAAVAATTAADLEELSTGMSKVASAANAMGVDFDDLNAQIATIVSVTRQAPESVGTALKTIYARLGDLKVDGVDEFGVKLGEVSSQLQTMGIEILDQNGNMRDMTSVMTEVAEKWNTWTRAQQQAAAVAMAGKRQYNNLVALFENWDMYSEALETSKDSLGTLQKQQDIYMESTSAKLKTLKATWQSLYQDLIKSDDINKGVEGITEIVDVLDKFVKGFGGGIKAISAFGILVANVFNKQIANAINQGIQNIKIYQNNIDLLQEKLKIIQNGTAATGSNSLMPFQVNQEANTQAQIEVAERLYNVRNALSQEQGQQGIQLQQAIGALSGDLAEIEIKAEKIKNIQTESNGQLKNGKELLELSLPELEEALQYNQQRTEALERDLTAHKKINTVISDNLKSTEEHLITAEDLARAYKEIYGIELKITPENENLLNSTNSIAARNAIIKKILEEENIEYSNEVKQSKEQIEDLKQIIQLKEQQLVKDETLKNKQIELTQLIEQAKNSLNITNITQSFTNLTSSTTMILGSINTLKQAFSSEEMDVGERFRYAAMGAGMFVGAIPQLITGIQKFSSITQTAIIMTTKFKDILTMSAKVQELSAKALNLKTKAEEANKIAQIALEKVDKKRLDLVTKKLIANKLEIKDIAKYTSAEELRSIAKSKGITLTKGQAAAIYFKAQADVAGGESAEAHALAEEASAAAATKASIAYMAAAGAAVILTAALLGIPYIITKSTEKRIENAKAAKEQAAAIKETNDAIKEEIDNNIKLYNSYLSLYDQYQKGNASKQDMISKTEELVKVLSDEDKAVAELTGNYDILAEKIQKLKLEGLQEKVSTGKKTQAETTEQFRKLADTNLSIEDWVDQNVGSKKFSKIMMEQGGLQLLHDYRESKMETEYDQTALDIIQNIDIDNIDSYENYNKTIEKIIDLLNNNSYYRGMTEEQLNDEARKLLNSLSDNNKNYYNRSLAIEEFLKEYEKNSVILTEEEIKTGKNAIKNQLDTLSDTDFNKVIISLDVDNISSEENIKSAINTIQNKIDSTDLNIVTSLRAKISSDKKLTKTELKEALGEQEVLTSEYEVGLADWDNQSQLDQVEILNDIVRDKIKIQKEYIENIKEIAKEQQKIEEERLENIKKEAEVEIKALEKKKQYDSASWTEEDEKRYNDLTTAVENAATSYAYWQEVAEKGLSYEDLNSITFDNLISGIDGLISETQVLADLVAKVGENWTIAGKDIQEFALNFPDVLAEQENFNYLQDGSIQLTNEGKQVLQESLDIYKEKIIAENEAYQNELQRQADIQLATAEMYRAQAQALDDYLNGKITATQVEKKLAKNEADFEKSLTETLGINDSELHNLMRQNGVDTTNTAQKNTQSIFDYWMSVGNAAAAASVAYDKGYMDPNIVGPSGKQSGGITVTAPTDFKVTETQSVRDFEMTPEEIAALRDSYLKAAEAAENEANIYLSKKLGAGVNTQAMLQKMDNAISGKGNEKSSSSKKDKEKTFDEEFDRYWEYKKAIDLLDKSLSRLEKQQSKLHGKELIDSLKKENELLEQQKANYNALFEAQRREAGELQGILQYYGGTFKDNGELANYADLTSNMLNQLTSGQVSEEAYEDFKKALERYDSLYYSEMQDTMDKLDDARRKQLENNLKAWETEIQIKLDLTEAKRNWNDFVRDIEQDFRKIYEDLTIESLFDSKNFDTYVDDLNTTLQAIYDVENEITKLSSTGQSDMFESMSEAQEKLKELGDTLIDNGKSLYELYENIWDNYIDKLDQTADNLNDINEEFEHITDELDHQRKIIELIYGEKAYDKMNKYYEVQQKNILTQIDSLKTQKEFWEAQFEAAYEMNRYEHNVVLNDMSTWTEDMRKAYDEMIDSQSNLNNMIVEGIENLTDGYLNKIAEAFDKLENNVWGMGLDEVKDDWDRITELADEYLDDIEGTAQVQMLINKVTDGIDNTSDLKLQQKLADFRDNEVQALMNKKDLTEDDLKLMEARYNIMLKEAALEDAQNAKNSMKLTRNTSGNWTYQYVADDDDVAQKRNDLLQSYQDLYKMADDAYQHSMELAMSSYETMQEKMRELAEDTTLSEEEKMIKIQEIQDTYLPMIEAAANNSELYKQEAIAATGMVFSEVCKQNDSAYETLTGDQKRLVDETKELHIKDYEDIRKKIVDEGGTYPEIKKAAVDAFAETNLNSQTVAADVIGQWADDDDSVKEKLTGAIGDIKDETIKFEDEMNKMQEVAGIDFGNVEKDVEAVSTKIDEMSKKTEEMVNKSTGQLETMREYVNNVAVEFENVKERIFDAMSAMANYKDATAAAVAEMNNLIIASKQYGGLGVTPGTGGGPGHSLKTGETVTDWSGWQDDPNGVPGLEYKRNEDGTIEYRIDAGEGKTKAIDMNKLSSLYKIKEEVVEMTKSPYLGQTSGFISDSFAASQIESKRNDVYTSLAEVLDDVSHEFTDNVLKFWLGSYYDQWFSGFATGGYTGEWDTSGKLAILHQKELVLNQDDTENFLKATSLLNNISKINGNIEDSIMTSILNMMGALAPKVSGFSMDNESSEVGGNVFNITAEFPNANDVTSIREAILSLPNLASQYVHQTV